jgi:hypothetical protein
MQILERKDIDKVKPRFQAIVKEAWNRGEEVPLGVIYLSDAPISKKDIAWARSLSLSAE